MKVKVGKTYKGDVEINFDKTPHLIGGGTSGYGKTNFIKVIMTQLIERYPNDVEFYLFDLKEKVELGPYEKLKQVKALAGNINESEVVLTFLLREMRVQQEYFREMHWNNIVDTPIKKRTFIIVDEAGEFMPESFMSKEEKEQHEKCQYMFSRIARIGRAFGFRELFFSQYTTADVLPRQIKMNADTKISFRVPADYASKVMLGESGAEKLEAIPGRALLFTGPNKYEIQVPKITDDYMNRSLGQYYETKRKDVTMWADETKREDTVEFIETRDNES
jgi:DNA segregation ATPase FtsK/SpoIIIE, S-DNA-T family